MVELKQHLGELVFLFERGRKTYEAYQKNEQSFLYARILKDNNDKIRATLIQISHLLPKELFFHCINLVHHLDVWSELWMGLFDKLEPKLNEKFIFQNNINYPSEAELALADFYRSI